MGGAGEVGSGGRIGGSDRRIRRAIVGAAVLWVVASKLYLDRHRVPMASHGPADDDFTGWVATLWRTATASATLQVIGLGILVLVALAVVQAVGRCPASIEVGDGEITLRYRFG